MKLSVGRCSAILVLVALGASLAVAQESRRDGNWWRDKSSTTRLDYIVGLFDGLYLGHNFSHWDLTDKDGKVDAAAVTNVMKSFYTYTNSMEHISNEQVVDGLNKVYSDYRNRRILIYDAVWLVVKSINGTSEKDMEVLISNYRKWAQIL